MNVAELRDRYAAMSDDQIVQLASESGLFPEAAQALNEERTKRALTEEDVADHVREVARRQLQMKAGNNVFFRSRGTGIAFRGKRFASQEDQRLGIQLRTRWFVLSWIPLFPLGTYRIRYSGPPPRFWHRNTTCDIVSQERLDWRMIFQVWSIAASVLLLVCLTLWLFIQFRVVR
jgi:hypothetical protein